MDLIGQSDDSWWIDFLENELDPLLDKDLAMLLEHSAEDRDAFESFRLVKQWVKESDPIGNWPVEGRLERMRSRIMAAVEGTPHKQTGPVRHPRRRTFDNSVSP